MAQHRRVETRGIIGTGMATDVERLRDIEEEKERRERAWRPQPEKGFGEVLTEQPPKGELESDSPEDPRKRTNPPSPPIAIQEVDGQMGARVKPELPKVAPDPRERLLHDKMARDLAEQERPTRIDLASRPAPSRKG